MGQDQNQAPPPSLLTLSCAVQTPPRVIICWGSSALGVTEWVGGAEGSLKWKACQSHSRLMLSESERSCDVFWQLTRLVWILQHKAGTVCVCPCVCRCVYPCVCACVCCSFHHICRELSLWLVFCTDLITLRGDGVTTITSFLAYLHKHNYMPIVTYCGNQYVISINYFTSVKRKFKRSAAIFLVPVFSDYCFFDFSDSVNGEEVSGQTYCTAVLKDTPTDMDSALQQVN